MDSERALHRALTDIVDQGQLATRLVSRGHDAYQHDEFLQLAGQTVLLRAGEAVARIRSADSAFIDDHPELELRQLKDARNVVAHRYDTVDIEIIWKILEVHLPRVAINIERFLKSQ